MLDVLHHDAKQKSSTLFSEEEKRMLRKSKVLTILAAAVLACTVSAANAAKWMSGEIIGKTGDLLQIKVSEPVKDGTIFQIKSILSDPPLAEAKTMSCTKEWPYIVLAKVMLADPNVYVPMGATAFTETSSVEHVSTEAPKKSFIKSTADGDRFSLQVGSFYPRIASVRESTADFWQEYRFNYSFVKLGRLDTMISAQYTKGTGDTKSDLGTINKTLEVVPVTLLGQFRLARMGSTNLVIGGGGGVYRIRSEERIAGVSTKDQSYHFGREFSAGLMSTHGWGVELRYRDVPDTSIQGLSLAFGNRF